MPLAVVLPPSATRNCNYNHQHFHR